MIIVFLLIVQVAFAHNEPMIMDFAGTVISVGGTTATLWIDPSLVNDKNVKTGISISQTTPSL